MTTTFLAAEIELSKQIGDYWSSTTTAAGSSTTLVDDALEAKADAWIDPTGHWAFLIEEPSSTAAIYDERMASSLDASAKTLTTLAFAQAPGTGINYEIHRLFSPSEKKRALIYAARAGFPNIHEKIWDESMVSGNWLKDGSFEIWTSDTALTHWTKSLSTLAKTSTAYYFEHGAYSCKIHEAAGYIQQTVTNWDDLKRLAGKAVTFSVRGWCDTASCLRISINDGTTETFSSFHDGSDTWTDDDNPLEVTATIDDTPSEITFKIYHALAAATETSYVDDARVICGNTKPRLYIAHLGLAQEMPHQVFIEPSGYSLDEPWALIHNAIIDTEGGYLYLPSDIPNDYKLRIRGLAYLDFYDSDGAVGTDWTDTINIDTPQTDILIAQAALYLYTQMAMPNFSSGDRRDYQQMMGFWQDELRKRIGKHGMDIPSVPTKWR